jgi:PHD/YefM family antitoxin component YafN of YafNO toxin-antitoxin module
MLSIQKKLVVDERGQPQEVIISWEQYQQIIEILGLDLDDAAIADLREARRDRIAEKRDAYVALNPAP